VDLLRLVRRGRPAGRRAAVVDAPHHCHRPTFVVLGVALGVFIGGGILRRLKRGRPDTWLYRQLQWRIATRHPLMAGWVGGHVLISRSGFWTTRRSASRSAR
jgi:conjugative transfer region protein (TIGR03750 family)